MGSTDPGLGENFVLKHGCDFCVFGDKPEGCCSFHYSLLFLTFPDWTKCLTEKKSLFLCLMDCVWKGHWAWAVCIVHARLYP